MSVNVGTIEVLARLKDELTPQLGNMRKATVAAAAGLAVLAKRGSDVERISTSFDRLTASAGQSGDAIVNRVQKATRGLISEFNIMEASNKALLLGLDVNEQSMADMAGAAVTLGQAMGQNANKSLDDLITALGRSSPLILDNLGLTVKVGEANATYAAELGKTAKELTDAEKKQAFFNAAMTAARQKTAELGGVQVTAADQYLQLKNAAIDWFDSLAKGTATAVPQFGVVGGAITDIANSFNQLGPAWLSVAPVISRGAAAIKAALAGVRLSSIAMWGALTGGVVLVVAAFVKFRKQIGDVLANVILDVAAWADKMLVAFEKATSWIPGFDEDMSSTREAIAKTAATVSEWADGLGEAETAVEEVSTVVATEYTPAVEAAEKATVDWSVSVESAIPAFREVEKPVKDLTEYLRSGLNLELLGTAEAILEVRNTNTELPSILDRVGDSFRSAFGGLKSKLKEFADLGNLASIAVTGGLERIGAIAADWLVPKIQGVVSKIGGFFKKLFGKGEDEAKKAAEAMAAAHEEAARKAAEAWASAMDAAAGAIKSGYQSAREAAVEAYAATYEAAMNAGLGVAEAARMASGAQIAEYQRVMEAAKQKYLEEVALEAALAAIKDKSITDVMAHVRQSVEEASAAYDIMRGAMQDYYTNSGQRADDASKGAVEAHRRIGEAAKKAYDDMNDAAAGAAGGVKDSMETIEDAAGKANLAVSGVASALSSIPSRVQSVIEITTVHTTGGGRSFQPSPGGVGGGFQPSPGGTGTSGGPAAGPGPAGGPRGQFTHTEGLPTGFREFNDWRVANQGHINRHYSHYNNAELYQLWGLGMGLAGGFQHGSNGLRDFGGGTPAMLHGREAVVTQDQIERMIAAAARGGGGGGEVVLHLDGQEVGRVMLDRMRRESQARGYA